MATEDKLKHAAKLLPQYRKDITPAEVLDAALQLLIEKQDPVRKAALAKARLEKQNQKKPVENTVEAGTPAPGQANPAFQLEKTSRYIPGAVRHTVYNQEQGRCSYVGPMGRRCHAAIRLYLDHRRTFSRGGRHTVENLRLLCPAHNRFVAPPRATG